jgi:four helix bundle protein
VTAEQLQDRTKKFSLQIILFFRDFPKSVEAQILGKQLLRSATSVTANSRAACRARSKREFIAKLSIAVEEADESLLWLELFEGSGIGQDERAKDLTQEAKELLYIFSSSRKSAINNLSSIKSINKSTNQ